MLLDASFLWLRFLIICSTGCVVNFRKEIFTAENIVDGHYDYDSVMHYGTFFFARERGLRTLRTCTEGVPIGQREKLSTLDVQKALSLYQCMWYMAFTTIRRHKAKKMWNLNSSDLKKTGTRWNKICSTLHLSGKKPRKNKIGPWKWNKI